MLFFLHPQTIGCNQISAKPECHSPYQFLKDCNIFLTHCVSFFLFTFTCSKSLISILRTCSKLIRKSWIHINCRHCLLGALFFVDYYFSFYLNTILNKLCISSLNECLMTGITFVLCFLQCCIRLSACAYARAKWTAIIDSNHLSLPKSFAGKTCSYIKINSNNNKE